MTLFSGSLGRCRLQTDLHGSQRFNWVDPAREELSTSGVWCWARPTAELTRVHGCFLFRVFRSDGGAASVVVAQPI